MATKLSKAIKRAFVIGDKEYVIVIEHDPPKIVIKEKRHSKPIFEKLIDDMIKEENESTIK